MNNSMVENYWNLLSYPMRCSILSQVRKPISSQEEGQLKCTARKAFSELTNFIQKLVIDYHKGEIMDSKYEVTFHLARNYREATLNGERKHPLTTLNRAWFPEERHIPIRNALFSKLRDLKQVRMILTARQLANFFIMRREDQTGNWIFWNDAVEIVPVPVPEKPLDISVLD